MQAVLASDGSLNDGLMSTRCYDPNTGYFLENMVTSVPGSMACGGSPAVLTVMESYQYDLIGNVQQRNEAWNQNISGPVASQSFSEGFIYDGLNRIASSTVSGQVQQVFTYSLAGNLLSKTGAGTYNYAAGSGTSGGPHAVKTISGLVLPFTYDINGNQLTGNYRSNTWTSFDMPLSLTYHGAVNEFPTNSSQFTYGPNHERRSQLQGSSNFIYYGGAQEVQMDGSHNVLSVKTYWPHGLGVEIDRPGQNASELDWTHTDNLGSVIAMTGINGNLIEAMGFDAWGSRRSLGGAPPSIATEPSQVTELTDNKGYTGQEMIDFLELAHLNGRVYDPLISKFLSGDPFVTDPVNGQNYNRYSYVLNNPANFTDPTGFSAASAACSTSDAGLSCQPDYNNQVVVAENSKGEAGFDHLKDTTPKATADASTIQSSSGAKGTPSSRPGAPALGVAANSTDVAWASKNGFYVHQRATYLAIGGDLSDLDVKTLADAHVYADSDQFQTTDNAFRHAMRAEGQTVQDADALANSFVRKQFDRAWSAPTREDALLEFGLALHTLQDSTSPTHSGFQEWTDHETNKQKIDHVSQELFNPGEGSHLYKATREAWRWFNDKQLPSGDLFRFGCDGCNSQPTRTVM